jgi:CRISPR-associated protein Csm3
MEELKLLHRIKISGIIESNTGLCIGGSQVGLEIGGANTTVIRNGLDGIPYIPGSSLKGKMRCLLERINGKKLHKLGNLDIQIHFCQDSNQYKDCFICNIFGIMPDQVGSDAMPTRLIVRDAKMNALTVKKLDESLYTDMPYTQVKTEVVIDRITSAATPRQIERVPAGSMFDFELVYNIYQDKDIEWLKHITEGMTQLQNDYIGGQGSRGYGQICFQIREDNKSIDIKSFNGTNLENDQRVLDWIKSMDVFVCKKDSKKENQGE